MGSQFRRFLSSNLLWTEGRWFARFLLLEFLFFILLFFFISLLASFLLALAFIAQSTFFLYFYRNPTRVQLSFDSQQLICPADGKVIAVEKYDDEYFTQRVAIFLSPLDVHVQWMPMAGVVKAISYKKGTFTPAFLEKSEFNEQNEVVVSGSHGMIAVRQIAGVLARRISCWLELDDEVVMGQKYGMIHFGSRVDILLPSQVKITVKKGCRVRGGVSRLGLWK